MNNLRINDLDKIPNDTSKIQNETKLNDFMSIAICTKIDKPKVDDDIINNTLDSNEITKPKVTKSTLLNISKPLHPTYKIMVLYAVNHLKQRYGSSEHDILDFIDRHWKIHRIYGYNSRFVVKAINALILEGKLKQMSNSSTELYPRYSTDSS